MIGIDYEQECEKNFGRELVIIRREKELEEEMLLKEFCSLPIQKRKKTIPSTLLFTPKYIKNGIKNFILACKSFYPYRN